MQILFIHLAWFGVADSGADVIPRPSAQLPGHPQACLSLPDVILGSYKFTGRRKMAIFACLNSHISGGGQRPSTKFGTVVDAPRLHFHLKARRDRANEFAAINGEYMSERSKMAIFASLNPHILGGGQRPPTKFCTWVEPPSYIFALKQDQIEQTSLTQ